MVIYAKTDGEVIYKFLQSLVTDEQIAEAPGYYDKMYGDGAFKRVIEVLGGQYGLDSNSEFDDAYFEEYANNTIMCLMTSHKDIKEGKIDDGYVALAHVLVAVKVGSHKVLSRMVDKLKQYFGLEVYDEEPVDSINVNKTKKE